MSRLAQQVIIVLIPPLALIFLVLGTIFLGIATPTEGGAMGAVGAILLAAAKGRLSLDVVRQALASTTRLSAFVMFILIGARVFSLTFYGVNGHIWVEHLLTSLPGGEYGFLIAVSFLVFFLAFFLDFFELAFIIVPLLAPAATALGIDLIWFGVLLGVNMQTSFMHPPFGFALFYLRSVAAREPYADKVTGETIAPITTGQIYWGAVPFVFIQILMIAIVLLFPGMVMHYKGVVVDPGSIEIKVPEMPGLGLPPIGAPPADGSAPAQPAAPGGSDLSQPPSFGGSAPAEPAPPAMDLTQPPSFGAPAPADLNQPPAITPPAPQN
jgi:tripartite ATP-independent transporter DctM subunit